MLMGPQNLPEHIQEVRERMAQAAAEAGRSAHSVTLLAVSKAQPAANGARGGGGRRARLR